MLTAQGPRQRVVASLGKLDAAEVAGGRCGWDDLTALLRGQAPARLPAAQTAELPGETGLRRADWQALRPRPRRHRPCRGNVPRSAGCASSARAISAGATSVSRSGTGSSETGYHAALLPAGRESVVWSHVAALLTVARFCVQRSELGVAEHGYAPRTTSTIRSASTQAWSTTRGSPAPSTNSAPARMRCAHTR